MLDPALVDAPPEPSAADEARVQRSNGRIVVQAWLASRGLIFAVALLLAVVEGRSVSEMVSNWDVRHFENLATNGYLGEADGTLMAFFPGLPGLLALGLAVGIPIQVTGVVLSLAGSAVASPACSWSARCSSCLSPPEAPTGIPRSAWPPGWPCRSR